MAKAERPTRKPERPSEAEIKRDTQDKLKKLKDAVEKRETREQMHARYLREASFKSIDSVQQSTNKKWKTYEYDAKFGGDKFKVRVIHYKDGAVMVGMEIIVGDSSYSGPVAYSKEGMPSAQEIEEAAEKHQKEMGRK